MLISVEPIFARLDGTSTSENAASDRRRKRRENVEPSEHGGALDDRCYRKCYFRRPGENKYGNRRAYASETFIFVESFFVRLDETSTFENAGSMEIRVLEAPDR